MVKMKQIRSNKDQKEKIIINDILGQKQKYVGTISITELVQGRKGLIENRLSSQMKFSLLDLMTQAYN